MLRIDNISFSYTKKPFINIENLSFEKGVFYAIIGPNGCGKTTLMNIISGLRAPKKGFVSVDGQDFKSLSKKELAKKIAYLPQNNPNVDMTVYDYVAYGRFSELGFLKKLSSYDREIVSDSLKKTDTYSFYTKSITDLSGGEKQRVYIASLLSQNTPYVLLDEPTTHLDISNQISTMNLLKKISRSDKCVISVIHELSLALKFCDVIILMERGNLTFIGTPDKTVNYKDIDRAFNVKCEEILLNGEKEYILNKSHE